LSFDIRIFVQVTWLCLVMELSTWTPSQALKITLLTLKIH
jgi:hypothetical protein